MMKLKIFLSWIFVLGIMAILFIRFISIYLSPLPPIRYAHIPRETIDFIHRITDQRIIINNNPNPDDWNNDKTGEGYLKSYRSLEDTNFIIYFLPGSKAADRAAITLKNANSAIRPLEQLMGLYFYPYQVNKRKLPIFITNSANEYNAIVQHFVHTDGGESLGITCFELSSYGFRTLGIVLSKESWANNDEALAKVVLWHEMNHYVFFNAVDIKKNPAPLTWIVEGTAEYFAKNTLRLKEVNKEKCSSIYLSDELKNHIDNYWVGYTALLSSEKNFGISSTEKFIRQNFIATIKPSIQNAVYINVNQFEGGWRSFVNSLP